MTVELLSSRNTKEPTYKLEFDLRRGEPHDPILVKKLRSGQVVYIGTEIPVSDEAVTMVGARSAPLR